MTLHHANTTKVNLRLRKQCMQAWLDAVTITPVHVHLQRCTHRQPPHHHHQFSTIPSVGRCTTLTPSERVGDRTKGRNTDASIHVRACVCACVRTCHTTYSGMHQTSSLCVHECIPVAGAPPHPSIGCVVTRQRTKYHDTQHMYVL